MFTLMKRSRDARLLVGGVLVALLLGAAVMMIRAQSDTVIYACVSKNGSLRIAADAQCGKGESSLAWNQQGPVGPQGPAGVDGLKVVDSNGEVVGYPFEHELVVPFNDRWYKFNVTADALSYVPPTSEEPYVFLYYESRGCIGTPYVKPDPDASSLYRYPRLVYDSDSGRMAYVAGSTTTTRTIWSWGTTSDGTLNSVRCAYPKEALTVDVVELVPFDLSVFVPPFRFSH